MSKLGLTCAVAMLPAVSSALAADSVRHPAPMIFGVLGWQIDRTLGVDDMLPPPAGGPGPVTFDRAHPYVPNGRGGQATYRVADLSNPILQDWVKPAMKKANDDVLAGKVPYRAHERCWPAGIPGINADAVGEPLFVYQGPKEVLFVMKSGPEIRHIYLDVPHSRNPTPSWYGESVGHFENDHTLVIDTIGFNDRAFIDNYRTPRSTQLHVVERWTVSADGKTVEVSAYVEDPGVFTTPWRAIQRWRSMPLQLEELPCQENNSVPLTDSTLFPLPQATKQDF